MRRQIKQTNKVFHALFVRINSAPAAAKFFGMASQQQIFGCRGTINHPSAGSHLLFRVAADNNRQ
jgi:hypothetical protein